jgi:pyrimidine deaminase RibD-like protein
MTRKSYNPSLLEKFKKNRKNYTLKQNKTIEPFMHGSLIVSRKGDGAIIGYGANTYNREFGSIHAEENALNKAKLFIQRNKCKNTNNMKRRIKVDMIVLRTTGGISKPCFHCITNHIVNNRIFNIRKVIYSDLDADGGYVVTNCNRLFNNRDEHISGFHIRNTNNLINNNNNNNNVNQNTCIEENNDLCNCELLNCDEDDEDKSKSISISKKYII